jgi:pSer/pThr/pTyr-binding forkhead associated (FHA) protein
VVQLNVLSGKKAGAIQLLRRFPVRIGRAESSELRLDEDGVWEQHLVLSFYSNTGFSLKTEPNALARVNGQPVAEALLRNGDTIELGVVRLQFWLSPARQSGLLLGEILSWIVICAVFLGQITILFWLLD